MESYFQNTRGESLFKNVEVLIYVMDAEAPNEEKNSEMHYLKQCLDHLARNGQLNARIFCLVHKMDLIAEEERDQVCFCFIFCSVFMLSINSSNVRNEQDRHMNSSERVRVPVFVRSVPGGSQSADRAHVRAGCERDVRAQRARRRRLRVRDVRHVDLGRVAVQGVVADRADAAAEREPRRPRALPARRGARRRRAHPLREIHIPRALADTLQYIYTTVHCLLSRHYYSSAVQYRTVQCSTILVRN